MAATQLIGWSSDFGLGLAEIDAQHQSLFDLINKTWQAVVERTHQETMLQLLEQLQHYTLAHFSEEEAFMLETGYPKLAEHQQSHLMFVERIKIEKAAVIAGGYLSLDLIYFLQKWLADHILVADRLYAEHAQQHNNTSLIGRFFKRFW